MHALIVLSKKLICLTIQGQRIELWLTSICFVFYKLF